MPPAFPGMNPYLESPDLWTEVHAWLIVQLARHLNPVLKPKYRAAVEQRVYNESLLVGIPDVSVFQGKAGQTQATTTTTLNKPIRVNLPMSEEVKETYLEIRQISTGQVITVIEVLSPKNKRSGEGRNHYTAKRRKVLESHSHLVEIDLLRFGEPLPMSGSIPSDYRILISRAASRPEADLYPFNLQEPIPGFSLPLQPGDDEPTIDLNSVLQEIYDQASFELVIDYTRQPVLPPVTESSFQWIQALRGS
ncbi:DUF4058 family protein [Nodosilinea sp. P-1105]|uniref:DUF4058 family protein n=1 Tax=Nodosilinea sp. P-1105 TaxID=2546229 RepID=UPI00146DC8D7|nr:DUF4058 family protein [Nodosilinea sp. P-1105]NMF86595.1 DUF4058 family protein [Nodosilinea sp. P-1105]